MRHPQTLKCVQIPSATDSLFFLAPNISNHTPKGSKPKQWHLLLVAAPTQAREKGEKEYEGRQDKSRLSYLKTAQNSGEATELELPAYPSRQRSFIEPPAAVLCTVTHTHSLSLNLSKYKDLTAILTNPIQAKFLSLPKYNNLTAILTNPIQGKTSNHTRAQILQTGNGEFSMKTWDRIPCPTSLTLVPSTLVGMREVVCWIYVVCLKCKDEKYTYSGHGLCI